MALVKRDRADKAPLALVEWYTIGTSLAVAVLLLGWTIYRP
ncbi:MAG: hypothetical protein SGJ19_13610 [Planctomycetia bacterium]|nr:hypothetical protein [Planctomycetia bacterium]